MLFVLMFIISSISPGDIDATVTIILGRQPRPTGVDALKCEDLAVSFHVGHATMKLGNLFGADDEFSKYTLVVCFSISFYID